MNEAPQRVRALRPETPEWLDEVILRCLEKNPRDRHGDMLALADALLPPGNTGPATTRRGAAWVAIGLAGASLVALGLTFHLGHSAPPAPSPPTGPSQPATDPPEDLTPGGQPEFQLSVAAPALPTLPDAERLLGQPLTPWLSALPPRSEVEARPGVWPPREHLARWTLLRAQGASELVRDEVLSRFPRVTTSAKQALEASEVFRCLIDPDTELTLLRPFRRSNWACASRCAQLGEGSLEDLDPQRFGISRADAETDHALARCFPLKGRSDSQPLADLLNGLRARELSPRQRAGWAYVVAYSSWANGPSRQDVLDRIDALLRQPEGLSLAPRLELLRARTILVGSVPPTDPAARLDTARRLLSWNPASASGLSEACSALFELERFEEASELARWLIEAELDPLATQNAGFVYCSSALRLKSLRTRKGAPALIRAIQCLYFASPQNVPPKLWVNLRNLLVRADSPETRQDVRRLARRAQAEGNKDYYAHYLTREAIAIALLDGVPAGLERLAAGWQGTATALEVARVDLRLSVLARQAVDQPQLRGKLKSELWTELGRVSDLPALRGIAGRVLLAEHYLGAGHEYLAYDLTLQAEELPDPDGAYALRLTQLREALGQRRPGKLKRWPLRVLDPSVSRRAPPQPGALPLPLASAGPAAQRTRWKGLELQGRYVQLRSEILASLPTSEAGWPRAWEAARVFRRLALHRWETYELAAWKQRSWRCALRLLVLNAAKETDFESVKAFRPRPPEVELDLARAEWNLIYARAAKGHSRLERAAELLAALDPSSLTPPQRAEWVFCRGVSLCLLPEEGGARACLALLDRSLSDDLAELQGEQIERLLDMRGRLLWFLGDLPEAVRTYRVCLSYDALHPHYITPLARALAASGHSAEALRAAEWVLQQVPSSKYAGPAALAAARALDDAPDLESSLRGQERQLIKPALTMIETQGSGHWRTVPDLQTLCFLARRIEAWDVLEKLARKGLNTGQGELGFHGLLAQAIYHGRGAAAYEAYLEGEVKRQATRDYARLTHARWELEHGRGDSEAARELAERVVANDWRSPILGIKAAHVLLVLGDHDRAREVLLGLGREHPDDERLRQELAVLQRRWGLDLGVPR